MRPRKRTNWPIVVYRYWVEPEYDTWERLPSVIKQEAEAMRALWNQLVDAFTQRQIDYYSTVLAPMPTATTDAGESSPSTSNPAVSPSPLHQSQLKPFAEQQSPLPPGEGKGEGIKTEADPDLSPSSWPSPWREKEPTSAASALISQELPLSYDKYSPLALRQLQHTFLRTIQEASKASLVTWANKQFVTTQFFATLTRFFKKQGDLPRRRTGEFHEVHFHHRFTEGGLPIERIFGHSQRLCLTAVSPEAPSPTLSQRQRKRLARTSGTFQVNSSPVRFRTILHRPLPSGAYLKTAALIGKRIVQPGYHWTNTGGFPTLARWNWSLQLTLEIPPFQLPIRERKTTAALLVRCELVDERRLCFGILTDATGREEALFLPEALLSSWQHKHMLRKQADHLLEATKQQLQDLQHVAHTVTLQQQRLSHLRVARRPGLLRLLHALEDEGVTDTAVQLLRQWADSSTKLIREARGLEQRYLGHRDWFYHNLALQLCQRYQQIVVTIAEVGTTRAQQNSVTAPQGLQAYRQLAAPARFLSFLYQAATKTGTEVKEDQRISGRRSSQSRKTSHFQTQFSGEKAETIAQSRQQ